MFSYFTFLSNQLVMFASLSIKGSSLHSKGNEANVGMIAPTISEENTSDS